MESLVGDLEAHGGMIAFHSEVVSGVPDGGRIRIETNDMELDAACVVNAAGLDAPDLARRLAPQAAAGLPVAHYAKGQYYTLSGRSPFRRLVYPVAEQGGLGVHVTLDLAGQARFGPDVVWIDGVDYTFDERNRARFVTAIRRYYPALDEARLQPGYTGIRPKISGPAEAGRRLSDRGSGTARRRRSRTSARHRVAGSHRVARAGRRRAGARRAALMLRVGVIVNPIAGIGGPAALKGSDGADVQAEALARGSRPRASERMRRCACTVAESGRGTRRS